MSRVVRAGFIMTNVLGHKSHAMNLREFAPRYGGVECTFAEVPLGVHNLRTIAAVKSDPVIQAGLEGRSELERFVKKVDVVFMHTETTALFSPDLMKQIPTIVSLDCTAKQWFDLNQPFFQIPLRYTVSQRLRMLLMKKTRLKERLNGQVMRNAVHIVSWSEWNKLAIMSQYGVASDKVTVISPGVDVSRFSPSAHNQNGTDLPVKILFVGGDFRRKGGEMLLQWAQNAPTNIPWEMHIVTRESVPDCPKGVIVYNDVQNNSDKLARLFQEADVFVLPTKADSFGVVLLEAMASGLPIVASRIAAIPEIVQHGKTGYVFDAENSQSFGKFLNELIADPQKRSVMGKEARAAALEHWSIEVKYGALLDLVRRVGSAYI